MKIVFSIIQQRTRDRDRIAQYISLQWRHYERDGVSNHRRLDCLLNHFSGR